MQITATHLRKDLFQVMEQAKQGEEVLITHKGISFRLIPEQPVSKLDRITPVEDAYDLNEPDEVWERVKVEMQAEWEAKWGERLRV